MKLFENRVGRPSNEILKKRRIIYGLIIGCIIVLIFVGVYTLSNFNTEKLSGAASNNSLEIRNVTINSFDIYWKSKKGISTFTVYSTNSKGMEDKKIGTHNPSYKTEKSGSWRIGKGGSHKDKILIDREYVITAKFKDGSKIIQRVRTLSNSYTIEYRTLIGSGSMQMQTIPYGGSTPLRANTFKNAGKKFIGWYAWRSQDNKWYGYNKKETLSWYSSKDIEKLYIYKNREKVGKTSAPRTKVIMYALWEGQPTRKFYVIKYRPEGGTGSMADQIVEYDRSITLPSNKFVNKGYKFGGWFVKRSDGTYYGYDRNGKLGWHKVEHIKKYYVYKNKAKVSKLAPFGTDVILYAKWVK